MFGAIMTNPAPTAKEELAKRLIDRADRFAELTERKRPTVSKKCSGQAAFLDRVAAGENFNIETYDRCMRWLDDNWPSQDAADQQDTPEAGKNEQDLEAVGHVT